jgi:hypothetical protein
VCCATKRLVEIHCPPDCVYLSSAKSHPPAVVQRRQERDTAFVLPLVSDLTEAQFRLLLVFQSVIVTQSEGAIPPVLDDDIAEGAAAAAATLETAGKGIIYEHQAVSVPAQRLTAELARVVGELVGQSGSHQARLERDAATAMRRLEQGARTAAKMLAGDDPPVYLKLLRRMLQQSATAGGQRESGGQGRDEGAPSGLIVPP